MNELVSSVLNLQSIELIYLHIFISITIALLSTVILKKRYKNNFFYIFFAILVFNLALPIISYILSLFISILLVNIKEKKYLHLVQKFNKKEFLNSRFPIVKRIFGEGTAIRISEDNKSNSKQKMKSLVFMSTHPDKKNFPIIKKLLCDNDDEVRLFSFSLINNAENELNEKIIQIQKEFNYTKDTKIAASLAQLYWDYIYYGFSNLENESLNIKKIKKFINIALEDVDKKAEMLTLLGKVYFYEKDYENALKTFQQALNFGVKKSNLTLYLAEIAYEKKAYVQVKSLLNEMNLLETSLFTAPIYQQWTKS